VPDITKDLGGSYSYTGFFIWPRRRIAQGTPR
jgi:hypothetical protein